MILNLARVAWLLIVWIVCLALAILFYFFTSKGE
jgi:hypothetical protein